MSSFFAGGLCRKGADCWPWGSVTLHDLREGEASGIRGTNSCGSCPFCTSPGLVLEEEADFHSLTHSQTHKLITSSTIHWREKDEERINPSSSSSRESNTTLPTSPTPMHAPHGPWCQSTHYFLSLRRISKSPLKNLAFFVIREKFKCKFTPKTEQTKWHNSNEIGNTYAH